MEDEKNSKIYLSHEIIGHRKMLDVLVVNEHRKELVVPTLPLRNFCAPILRWLQVPLVDAMMVCS